MTNWTLELPATGRSAEQLSALLHLVYGAAAQPQQWPAVLDAVASSLQGRSGVLFTPFLPPHEGGMYHALNITPEQSVLWATKYIDLDIWTNRAFERGLVTQGAVITDVDTATEEELRASQIYREMFSKMDVGRFCSGVIFDNGSDGIPVTVLTTHRSFKVPPFSPQDRAWLALLLPHLSRALGLMYRLDNARLQTETMLSVLDSLPLGVMLLNLTGQVVHCNNAAREVLARNDGLSCNRQAMLEGTPADSKQGRLDLWLKGQCSIESVDVNHFANAYMVQRTGGEGLYSVQCCPLNSSGRLNVLGQQISSLVFLTDPEAVVLPEASRLIGLYGLTPAQAQVALELARGKSSKEAARTLNIAPETVRSHTQQVYQKIRVQSQPDLVRSILTLGHVSI